MGVVLLVGGAGYVGSVLANELIERGQRVRILDRLYFGEQGLTGIRDRVELVVGDMRTIEVKAYCQAPGLMESWLAGFLGCGDRGDLALAAYGRQPVATRIERFSKPLTTLFT